MIDANPLRDVATDGSKVLALFLPEAPAPDLLTASDPRDLAPGRRHAGRLTGSAERAGRAAPPQGWAGGVATGQRARPGR